ncbi:LOW QUALITY PROTEIN: hypothetical protein V2J09_020694 [Rumex salicifolius]
MLSCNPCKTPVDTNSKMASDIGDPVSDPTRYRSIASSLQFLTFTRPDISYAVQQICLHMHDSRDAHLQAMKPILRYRHGLLGLDHHSGSVSQLIAYFDADWAGCPDSKRSTSGYCVFLGPNLVSWSSKRQPTSSQGAHFSLYVRHCGFFDNVSVVAFGEAKVLHVPTTRQFADIFTKGLPSTLFNEFRDNLCLRVPPTLTGGVRILLFIY